VRIGVVRGYLMYVLHVAGFGPNGVHNLTPIRFRCCSKSWVEVHFARMEASLHLCLHTSGDCLV
jgi:hypothetical protein